MSAIKLSIRRQAQRALRRRFRSCVPLDVLLLVVLSVATGCGSEEPAKEPTKGGDPGGQVEASATLGSGAAGQEGEDGPAGSWWKVGPPPEPEAGGTDLSDEALRRLASLGYLGAYQAPPARLGVVHLVPERAYSGYNLVVSGHGPEALLTDMSGAVVHRWRHEAPADYGVPPNRNFWRRAHLLEDGGLLAIFDPFGIIKLDRDSRLTWATDASNFIHHDLDVATDGRIYTLGKRTRQIPGIHDEVGVVEDLVVVIDAERGAILERFSIFEAFQRSSYAEEIADYVRHTARLGAELGQKAIEDFHTNTIQVFDGSLDHLSPLFKKGNMIFCSPHLNNVFIIDGETRSVVWNWFGPWYRIHEPQLVDDGAFLLFHNNGYKEEDRASQILLYDLLSKGELWSFGNDPANGDAQFFSGTSSTVSRLPNGNTLIVASESGRALEVTAEKEVVWEYFNPQRAGASGELIAAIFQLDRVPDRSVVSWLSRKEETGREAGNGDGQAAGARSVSSAANAGGQSPVSSLLDANP